MSDQAHQEDAPLIYVVAGEPSGDLLGGKLMQALKQRLDGKVRFAGIGGEAMEAEGLHSRVALSELAIMGVLEVLPQARRISAASPRRSPISSARSRSRSSPSTALALPGASRNACAKQAARCR